MPNVLLTDTTPRVRTRWIGLAALALIIACALGYRRTRRAPLGVQVEPAVSPATAPVLGGFVPASAWTPPPRWDALPPVPVQESRRSPGVLCVAGGA